MAHDDQGTNGRCNATDILVHCVIVPPLINSIEGIWGFLFGAPKISRASLQALEFQIMVVLATTHLVNMVIIKNIGNIPIFVSQLIAGLLIGSAVFGQMDAVHSLFFPTRETLQIYDLLGSFGLLMSMFLVGVKTSPRYALSYGKNATMVGIAISLIPSIVGFHFVFSSTNDKTLQLRRKEMMGPQLTTALPVISQLLIDLKISNTEMGRRVLATAFTAHSIDLAAITVFIPPANGTTPRWVMVVGTIVFIATTFLVLRPLMRWMIRRSPMGLPLKEWIILMTMLLTFICCVLVEKMGHIMALGSFIFGLAVPEGPPLGSALEEKFECIINGMLMPLFVASITMRLSPRSILEDSIEVEFATKTIMAIFLVKLATCFAMSMLLSKMPWKQSLTFSLIMSSKGIVDASFYVFTYHAMINPEGIYALAIICILLNSAILPIVIGSLYNSIYMGNIGYEKGNIMDLKQESELKALICVHEQDEIAPLISILNSFGYSEESRMAVYVLQLKQLTGSSTPFFIAHDQAGYEKKFINGSSSHEVDMILAFYQLEQKSSAGSVMVNSFTAISPPNTMHMDICTLACEQHATFIILPFHRKWSVGGTVVDSESGAVRNMNRAVMENAFCSVGILVHRHCSGTIANQTLAKLLHATSFNVCMFFFGGNDDREALALVQRMARDPKVCLTVIHFIRAKESNGNNYNQAMEPIMNWDMILDTEELKAIKNNEGGNVHYKEEIVKDGPETTKRIRGLVNCHDLVVVGRRYGLECPQTSSLSEWTEFPELGIIGDFLASTDVRCDASILIVQRQNDANGDRELEHVHQVKTRKLTSMNIRN